MKRFNLRQLLGLRAHEAKNEPTWSFDAVFDYLGQPEVVFTDEGAVVGSSCKEKLVEPERRAWLLAFIASLFVSGSEQRMVERLGLNRPLILDVFDFWRKQTSSPFGKAAMVRAHELVRRKWPHRSRHVPHHFYSVMAFHALVLLEDAWLGTDEGDPRNVKVEVQATTREPWVTRPARDYLGLALSGGGIRSATFNLGLLQALAEKGVLDHVDYLSTVSGGGYIGGFWSAWRHHHPKSKTSFPTRGSGPRGTTRELSEVRHLREFSRFLIPRVGFTQSETWLAVSAVLGGSLASLIVMTAAVAACLYAWVLAAFSLTMLNRFVGAAIFAVVTAVIQIAAERKIERLGKLGDEGTGMGIAFGVVASVLSFFGWVFFSLDLSALFGQQASLVNLPLLWIGVAMSLLLARVPLQRVLDANASRRVTGTLERAVSRCLAPALVVSGLGLIWWLAGEGLRALPGVGVTVGAGSAGAAALFVWLRDWLRAPVQETRGSKLWERVQRVLKPLLPQLAAAVAVVLYFVGVALLMQRFSPPVLREGAPWSAWNNLGFFVALGMFVSSLVLFDPSRTGLHEFYRARIARCFLGAARADKMREKRLVASISGLTPAPAVATVEQAEDEISLAELREGKRRPLQLVCCAANNLAGDVLGSLYRGARSAVLSPFGISVGNFAAPRDELGLSAALTASAAAFNSQMGEVSMRLGPAVAFLMCTLNLRLGLWVPHPLNLAAHRNWFPGWYFFLEALGLSRADQVRDKHFFEGENSQRSRAMKLHLSDGGHFENLGIYELVRRHCRYIIVSDVSADPDGSFESLGNAIRRVREDFGVEIEIDVSPLRANRNGHAARHAVIGSIHFDGLNGNDKGLLMYFKPTLTGDEPNDVLEYRVRHPAFPHDGTEDQFYDEAQWESYRRLGQHVGAEIAVAESKGGRSAFLEGLFSTQSLQSQRRPKRDALGA